MKINAVEILNVLIVLYFLFFIKRQRDTTTLLLILFAYGTSHFSFGALMLAQEDGGLNFLNTLHTEGGGVLAKLSALSLLGVIFVLLSRKAYDAFLLSKGEKKIILYVLLVMGTILCGYILNIRSGDWLQFKNVVSIEAMLAFLLIGYLALGGVRTYNVNLTYSWCFSGLVLLFVANCVGFYEVFCQQSWAATPNDSGEQVWRACSILFNPNLFAYWASLVYLGCAYGMHAHERHRKMMLLGMVLASISIYLSGSRSACMLLVGMLFFPILLIKQRLRWVPLMVLPLTMLTIYVVAEWLVISFIASGEGWRKVALLGERFAATPLNLANYVLMKTGSSSILSGAFSALFPGDVSDQLVESIEGRFVGVGQDAGWMVLYQDVGWFGLAAIIWGACMLVARGVRAYIAHPSPSSVYALIMLLYCLMSGFGMRFQIFPVWLFNSLVIISCSALWREHKPPTLNLRN